MNAGAAARALTLSEARALLPLWVWSVVAATVAALTTNNSLQAVGLFGFLVATVGLNAQSVGHDYADQTLGLSLTLPVARQSLFLVKLGVVGAMVASLLAYGWLVGLPWDIPPHARAIAATGLCLAPWMTMVCRNALAGTLFSLSLPATLAVVVLVVMGVAPGDAMEIELSLLASWSPLIAVVMAGGAALSWRRFMRLEAVEGRVAEIQLPWTTRAAAPAAAGHPLWQLAKKELRLQQLTFGLMAWYVATTWPSAVWFRATIGDGPWFIGGAIFWLGLPVVVGSLAIAYERQLGTLSWQLQLPLPAWQQWSVKMGIVFGLALLSGVGGLAALAQIFPAREPGRFGRGAQGEPIPDRALPTARP
jgi:hypothetical protein